MCACLYECICLQAIDVLNRSIAYDLDKLRVVSKNYLLIFDLALYLRFHLCFYIGCIIIFIIIIVCSFAMSTLQRTLVSQMLLQ